VCDIVSQKKRENNHAKLQIYTNTTRTLKTKKPHTKRRKRLPHKTRPNTTKTNQTPENKLWTYNHIQAAYNTTPTTIATVAKRFVTEGMEAALGRKKQLNYHAK